MDVPDSCCAYLVDELLERCYGKYQEGCINRLSIIVHRSALYIGTGAVAIALIQVNRFSYFFQLNFNLIFRMSKFETADYYYKART